MSVALGKPLKGIQNNSADIPQERYNSEYATDCSPTFDIRHLYFQREF